VQNDESITRKNKPLPENKRPDWAKLVPEEEWQSYVHSPQCRVCNANHKGRNIRSEIEALVIGRKTYVEVCDIMFERYGLQLAPHNISRHMARHAPSYTKMLGKLLQNDLGDVLDGAVEPFVDHISYLFGVIQVSWQQMLDHPEKVSVADGIRAAEKFALIAKGSDFQHDIRVTQEELNQLLDMMQAVMTREQIEEVERRFWIWKEHVKESESSPPEQGRAPATADDEGGWMMAIISQLTIY
jgi:hypothetical protein